MKESQMTQNHTLSTNQMVTQTTRLFFAALQPRYSPHREAHRSWRFSAAITGRCVQWMEEAAIPSPYSKKSV